MRIQPCPQCHRPGPRFLEAASAVAPVNYYGCNGCGHVFHVAKGLPDAPPVSVTRIHEVTSSAPPPHDGDDGGSSATS